MLGISVDTRYADPFRVGIEFRLFRFEGAGSALLTFLENCIASTSIFELIYQFADFKSNTHKLLRVNGECLGDYDR